ncbi:MAG: hypothetical protein WBL20_21135 [Sphingobium sp.]|uniref:hypothetical protein n=1 Tax=Sphingobium sp. TaxID=1912891 RepID=UPI002E20777F
MRIVDSEEIQWHTGPGHRDPGIYLRDVLTGQEGGPGNYWLSLIRIESAYDAPIHGHNFDQVRVMLEGTFNFGEQDQAEGTIGYFCEGTPYTQSARGRSLMLLLQCEGASASRFLSQAEMRRGVVELKAAGGDFRDGRYIGPHPLTGAEVTIDSVEAIWQHIVQEPIAYPPARYERPVIVHPQAIHPRPIAGAAGASERLLGLFNERGLRIALRTLEPGGTHVYDGRTEGSGLLFVTQGEGTLGGADFGYRFAAEIGAEEAGELVAGADGLTVLVIRLPD